MNKTVLSFVLVLAAVVLEFFGFTVGSPPPGNIVNWAFIGLAIVLAVTGAIVFSRNHR